MKTLLESLKLYFQKNSREQIEKDWAELEKFDKVGPTVEEFFSQSKFFSMIEVTADSYWEFNLNQIAKNPKFTSDFFLPLTSVLQYKY